MISRKKMLKIMSGAPLLGALGIGSVVNGSDGAAAAEKQPFYERDFFKEVGVEPLINAAGTYTTLGGALMLPEAVNALSYTAKQYARLNEVQNKVGARIAEMLECEAAMVTAGAASALTLSSAAGITLGHEEKIEEIPITSEPRPEIIVQESHRNGYNHYLTLTGAKLVYVEGADGFEEAVNENTIMAHYLNKAATKPDSISREEFVDIGT